MLKKKYVAMLVLTSLLINTMVIPAYAEDKYVSRKIIKHSVNGSVTTYISEKINEYDEQEEDNIFLENNNDVKNEFYYDSETIRYLVPSNDGFKSFLVYKAITAPSKQLDLQYMAINDVDGARMVEDRYCIAVGTHFDASVGTYVDLKLKNGLVIPCIVGDIKADKDTDGENIFTRNGCCSEFIINKEQLPDKVRSTGDMSHYKDGWDSPVDEIVVYRNQQV